MPKQPEQTADERLEAIVKKELEPLKETNAALSAQVATLTETVASLTKEKEALKAQADDAVSLAEKLTARNKKLMGEVKFMSEKARSAVEASKKKLAEAKAEFVERASRQLEEHINSITPSAFSAARELFEKEFAPVEADVLKEMGRLLSPYLTSPSLPAKLERVKKFAEESMKETRQRVGVLTSRNKALQDKLVVTLKENRDMKIREYREKLVAQLPSNLQESARERMAPLATPADMKRVYVSVLKESASAKPPKSEETKVPAPARTPEPPKPVINESAKPKPKPKVSQDGGFDINDPSMLDMIQ